MAPKDKYTDPKLREEIKEEIHNSDKGGKPGQWSARKAQMMASEYKKRGGDYTTSKQDGQSPSQKHLNEWTNEEWQTKEGSGTARKDDENGTRKRYLPKKAWEQMSEGEKEETEEKKVEGSKEGRQVVGNTERAREARRDVSGRKGSGDEEEEKGNGKGKKGPKTRSSSKDDGDDDQFDEEEDEEDGNEKNSAGTKRTAKQSTGSNKKQKENGKKEKEAEDADDGQEEDENEEEYIEDESDVDEDVNEEEEE